MPSPAVLKGVFAAMETDVAPLQTATLIQSTRVNTHTHTHTHTKGDGG